jgi:excisionase family DNA binding protein
MSSNIKVQRICQFCHKEFVARTTVTKYCSHKCGSRAGKARARLGKIQASHNEMVNLVIREEVDLTKQVFLTVKQAARMLNSSPKSVYNMIDSGRLPAARMSSRKTWIRRCDIDELFSSKQPLVDLRPLIAERPLRVQDCYTIGEVQEKFGISDSGLNNLLKRHEVPRLTKGWFVYVPKKEIERLLKAKDQ